MATGRRTHVGYCIYFLVTLTFTACNVINYTVITPPTIDYSFVINLTSTAEPKKEATEHDNSGDIIAEFLENVDAYANQGEPCKPGTESNLGEGVIQQYGINRFKRQALLAEKDLQPLISPFITATKIASIYWVIFSCFNYSIFILVL